MYKNKSELEVIDRAYVSFIDSTTYLVINGKHLTIGSKIKISGSDITYEIMGIDSRNDAVDVSMKRGLNENPYVCRRDKFKISSFDAKFRGYLVKIFDYEEFNEDKNPDELIPLPKLEPISSTVVLNNDEIFYDTWNYHNWLNIDDYTTQHEWNRTILTKMNNVIGECNKNEKTVTTINVDSNVMMRVVKFLDYYDRHSKRFGIFIVNETDKTPKNTIHFISSDGDIVGELNVIFDDFDITEESNTNSSNNDKIPLPKIKPLISKNIV